MRKTDEDHEEIARLEFLASLYYDADMGPYLPGDNVWRSLYDGAKKHKMGPRIKEGVIITTDVNPLAYGGPRTLDALWGDENYRHLAPVKVQMSRTMRCRPIFRHWKVDARGVFDPNVIDISDLSMVADTAGSLVGVGDWRPRYGRFEATVSAA